MPLAIEARGIVKAFPGVLANDQVDFDLRVGEVHALLGENGAGKSTLMNVLAGLYQPDAGELLVDGRPVGFRSPRDAIAAGIGMVHQHFTLVPSQTVTENVLLGLPTPRFRLDLSGAQAAVAAMAASVGMLVDPGARIWQLSVGEQQRVEILKMLYRGARILIMDEPTAVLAPQEAEELFATLRTMTAGGRSVVFISHKLGEVLAIADRVTVMRAGRVTAGGMSPVGSTPADLARLMVGRPILEALDRDVAAPGRVVLSVEDVSARNDRGILSLRDLSLTVHAGEIVGIAAVAGNGQAELAEAISGLRPCTGRIVVEGTDIAGREPVDALRAGVGHVPEDRARVGSAPNLSVVDNLAMKRFRSAPLARGPFVDRGATRAFATRLRERYAIAAPSIDAPVRVLSGGNLQRLILAREIDAGPAVLVAVQPTRGLDVGAIETVHRLLLELRARGTGILLISEELDELRALADRLLVMFQGRISAEMAGADADVHEIGLHMTGGAGVAALNGVAAARPQLLPPGGDPDAVSP